MVLRIPEFLENGLGKASGKQREGEDKLGHESMSWQDQMRLTKKNAVLQ